MVETTAKLDEKGRIRIPKQIREAAHLKEGSCVNIKTKVFYLLNRLHSSKIGRVLGWIEIGESLGYG